MQHQDGFEYIREDIKESKQANEINPILKGKDTVDLKVDFAIDRTITKDYIPGLALTEQHQKALKLNEDQVQISKFGVAMDGCASGLTLTQDITPSQDNVEETLIKLINGDTSCQLKISYIYLCPDVSAESPCRYSPSPKPEDLQKSWTTYSRFTFATSWDTSGPSAVPSDKSIVMNVLKQLDSPIEQNQYALFSLTKTSVGNSQSIQDNYFSNKMQISDNSANIIHNWIQIRHSLVNKRLQKVFFSAAAFSCPILNVLQFISNLCFVKNM